jgi:hypothetical protein
VPPTRSLEGRVRRRWPTRPDGGGNPRLRGLMQRINEDATMETEVDEKKRVYATEEESKGESEKEMVKETGWRSKSATLTMNLDGKCERVGGGD